MQEGGGGEWERGGEGEGEGGLSNKISWPVSLGGSKIQECLPLNTLSVGGGFSLGARLHCLHIKQGGEKLRACVCVCVCVCQVRIDSECVCVCVCKTLGFRKRSFNALIKCIEKHINMSNRTHNELQRHIPNQIFTVQLRRDQDSF